MRKLRQMPTFTQPERNKARVLHRQAALLSLGVLEDLGSSVHGAGDKGMRHRAWPGLAEEPSPYQGDRKARWTGARTPEPQRREVTHRSASWTSVSSPLSGLSVNTCLAGMKVHAKR